MIFGEHVVPQKVLSTTFGMLSNGGTSQTNSQLKVIRFGRRQHHYAFQIKAQYTALQCDSEYSYLDALGRWMETPMNLSVPKAIIKNWICYDEDDTCAHGGAK